MTWVPSTCGNQADHRFTVQSELRTLCSWCASVAAGGNHRTAPHSTGGRSAADSSYRSQTDGRGNPTRLPTPPPNLVGSLVQFSRLRFTTRCRVLQTANGSVQGVLPSALALRSIRQLAAGAIPCPSFARGLCSMAQAACRPFPPGCAYMAMNPKQLTDAWYYNPAFWACSESIREWTELRNVKATRSFA